MSTSVAAPPRVLRPTRRLLPSRRALTRGALAGCWALLHPREPFVAPRAPLPTEPVWLRTPDGWEVALRRIPARPGSPGEPVVFAPSIGNTGHAFDPSPDRSLAARLHALGFDVWWFAHRGTPGARSPSHPTHCDLDAVVEHELPLALDRITEATGADRVLWVGHGLGGHIALAHLARGGRHIAAATLVSTPVRFERPRTRTRLMGRLAAILPQEWRVPTGDLADLLAPGPGAQLTRKLAPSCTDAERRAALVHGTCSVRVGMIRQAARWLEAGHLTDRTGQIDIIAGLTDSTVPLQVVQGLGDPLCPAGSVAPLLQALPDNTVEHIILDERWGHLDPLLGPDAPDEVHPQLTGFLASQRETCWSADDF